MVGAALTSADFADPGLTGVGTLGLGSLTDARLLVIDDSSFARKTINAILANHGFGNVKLASDGGEGIELALEWNPEIIITDLYMPVKSGFDLCRELREHKEFAETPVIVQTSADTPALRGDVFEAGASDLITKPINARELMSRIRVHLERLRLIESLKDYRRQMREELNSAKAMQMELLPADQLIGELEQLFPVRFAWHSQPCQGLGGDIWGADQLDENRIRIWNADFTGHGVKSALNTFRLNTFLRTSLKDDQSGPARWLQAVNAFLCEVLPVGQFATMLCCDIDFSRNKVIISSAGAPEPMLECCGVHRSIPVGGMPLGISEEIEYEESEEDFAPGSSLFAYSDALTETPTAEDALYDAENLVRRLDELSETCVRKRPMCLLDDLNAVAPKGLDDDLTMIFLEYRTSADQAADQTADTGRIEENGHDAKSVPLHNDQEGGQSLGFEIRTMAEASELAETLAEFYPEPETVATGLWELLANAIEHGNLGISHSEKTSLLLANDLDQEIERRLASPQLGRRKVQVGLVRSPSAISLTIRDEGEGFDYQKYLDGEARLDAPNGRGIAIAQKLSFDKLTYHGRGNMVEALLFLSDADASAKRLSAGQDHAVTA
ncbi:ATP-binding SpoIIE family protein phosphatase [Roseibium sp.]|uniref:ATP-binding SpoIIE family protein phosphatase n=1 Tax=Roseibium sp. TaxID=1936156 RepID=UPI003A9782E9